VPVGVPKKYGRRTPTGANGGRGRCSPAMTFTTCKHDTLHSITSEYDHKRKVLTYYRKCEDCGLRLGDVARLEYRPDFDPGGNEDYLSAA
jgi:hypothetical protein